MDVPRLVTAYYSERPDPAIAAQRVAFGTSGHRGSSLDLSFNELHVLSISQAICEYRRRRTSSGPLFIGFDTHALSAPAFASALEVLGRKRGRGDDLGRRRIHADSGRIARHSRPTTAAATAGLADGIVITPSHNPPDSGGFKYNPPDGGPADSDVTEVDRNPCQ